MLVDLLLLHIRRAGKVVEVLLGTAAGAGAEDDEVGEAVATEAVGPVQSGGTLAGGEESGDAGHLGDAVDADTTHVVVQGGSDFHRLGGDVDLRQLLELVVHGRQLALHEIGIAVADIQVCTAMLGATAALDLTHDGAGDDVAGQQLGWSACLAITVEPALGFLFRVGGFGCEAIGNVVEHEADAIRVGEDTAFTTDALGDEDAADGRGPNHSGGVELGELHVHQLGTRPGGHAVTVAGVLPRVGSHAPCLAGTTGGKDHRRRLEDDEAARLTPVGEHATDLAAIHQQVDGDALHVHIHALVNAVVLQGTDQLETGAVADVGEARVTVSAEVSLVDETGTGAIENRAPVFQFTHTLGSILGVDRRHLPDVEELAAAHGVAEVDLPVVAAVDVAEGSGHAAFRHHRVGFAEQALGDDAGVETKVGGLDGGTQSGTAGADDEHVVFDGLDLVEINHGASFLLSAGHGPRVVIGDPAVADGPDIQIGKHHPEEADPGERHVTLIEPGRTLPDRIGQSGAATVAVGKAVETAADDVSPRVATKGVTTEENHVEHHHQGSHPKAELVAGGVGARDRIRNPRCAAGVDRHPQCQPEVVGQDEDERDRTIHGIAVQVLDQQQLRFTVVGATRQRAHRAPRRRTDETAVVGLAVVVAGATEGSGEKQNEERRRQRQGDGQPADHALPEIDGSLGKVAHQ